MRNENSAGNILDISAVAAKILGQNARKTKSSENTLNAQKSLHSEKEILVKKIKDIDRSYVKCIRIIRISDENKSWI